MSEKHRALPPWMSKKDKDKDKVKEPLKSKRKPKVARSVFYCMNEKELVEAAVSYLLTSRTQTDPKTTAQTEQDRGDPGSKQDPAAEVSLESSDSGDDQDRTYVSESDMDITEAETLPYPMSTEGNKGREVQDCKEEGQNVNKDGVSQAATKDDKKEDDAFQLVREIFFT
ncbi:hypothetical protein NL108_012325 [Boleophthalmus pectinirostris]|uniref:uncharacterized protein si:ch211-127m7.2 n=1 Tax=Boleophthalmus pectinirostris TaxID=150288 RepID=UPI00242D4032|nr:uncharacterized protein si:ch211-127m7.2 [Boleophthalmus pectinirostris]KAJ0069701.1 hypothetical protein NL108_012325 [Boleophthalmus pectinirostris]